MTVKDFPREYFNIAGMQVTVEGDTTAAREALSEARSLMYRLELMTPEGLKQNWLNMQLANDGTIAVNINHGVKTAHIFVPPVPEAPKIIELPPDSFSGGTYVLLVEMEGGPAGFAVFEPRQGGELALTGWTNQVVDTNKDPLGVAGQETYRLRWCSQKGVEADPSIPWKNIEQMKRVDQGYLAYDGDPWTEEVTECGTMSNYWTFENIAFAYHWISVDPGPPDPGYCGYTWAVPVGYGGPGGADYWQEAYLFYMTAYAYPTHISLINWWPEEFNQYLIKFQYNNNEGGAFKFKEYENPAWDDAFYIGVEAACGYFLFENTLTASLESFNDTERIWGIVWGTGWINPDGTHGGFPESDRVAPNDFPYTDYKDLDPWRWHTHITEYHRMFSTDGVYVYDTDDLFIQGCTRLGGQLWYEVGGSADIREEIDIGVNFEHPEDLTERQLVLLEGNGEGFPAHGITTRDNGETVINCGGIEYVVVDETVCGTWADNDFIYQYHRAGNFRDYGIFTKDKTGVDEENNIVPTEIEPIYAYSCEVVSEGSGDVGTTIIYGMVIDGEHYKSEEFNKLGPNSAYYDIPTGSEYRCTCYVRIGLQNSGAPNKPGVTITE